MSRGSGRRSDVVRPAFAPLPLEQLHAATQHALDRVIALRGRSELEAAIRGGDELAAAQLARGLREMGVTQGISFDADSLRVAAPMRRAFERLAAGLVNHGVLAKKEGRWEPTPGFVEAADSAGHVLRSFIEKHPGHLPEALLCAANCAELGLILRGEKDAVQVLFSGIGADLLDQFYGDGLFTSQWLGSHRSRAGCGRATSAGRARTAHSRNRRGHRRTGLAGLAAPRAWFAFLHLQRCLRGVLFCGAAKARRVSGSGIQDFRSRKTGRGAGAGSGVVRLHHRHQRCARGQRCARPRCEICTICSRRAEASFSWISPRRNSGRRRSSD